MNVINEALVSIHYYQYLFIDPLFNALCVIEQLVEGEGIRETPGPV